MKKNKINWIICYRQIQAALAQKGWSVYIPGLEKPVLGTCGETQVREDLFTSGFMSQVKPNRDM